MKSGGYTLTDQWLAVCPEHLHLDEDVVHALNEVGGLWSDYWRKQTKAPSSPIFESRSFPMPKCGEPKKGLTLSVKIFNHSCRKSRTLVRPMNGMAASGPRLICTPWLTHVQAKHAGPLVPIFLKGEQQDAAILTRIAPGKSVTVELRMDWPGTGSVKATPLLSLSESESQRPSADGFRRRAQYREYAASAVRFVKIVDE